MRQSGRNFRTLFAVLLAFTVLIGVTGNANTGKVEAATALSTPSLTVVSVTPASVNLKYSKVNGATGYQIYRAATKSGTYTKIKTTTGLTYKDTKTVSSKPYYYKVRAYRKGTSKNIYSSFSSIKTSKAVLSKPSSLTAKAQDSGIRLSWKSVSNAASYRIYRSVSKNGTYSYLASAKSGSYTDRKVTQGKTYYYKVRCYSVISGTKYYSNYTGIVSAKAASSQSSGQTTGSYQQQVIDLINKERSAAGLSKVTTTAALENAAYKRAKEIVDVFSHTRPDGSSCFTVLKEYNISYMACGENIAWGQKTPAEVMNAWMNSDGHRKNILSSNFGKVGIGYYVVNNTAYWVQMFTN